MGLVEAFRAGGPFMWPILVVGVLAAVVAAERLWFVGWRAALDARAFGAEIQRLVLADRLDRALQLCLERPEAVVARVVRAGLVRADHPEREIAEGVEEAVLEVAPAVTKRTGYLSMLANVATLTGLLGTIAGLVEAFAAAGGADAADRAQLSAGIGVAMYTTGFGLLVAIPTLVAQSVVVQRSNRLLDDVDLAALRTVRLLVARQRGTRPQAEERAG